MDFEDECRKKRIWLRIAVVLVVAFCVALGGGVPYHFMSGESSFSRLSKSSGNSLFERIRKGIERQMSYYFPNIKEKFS